MSFQDEMKQMFLQVAAGKVEPEEWEIFDQFARNGEIYSMEPRDYSAVLIPLASVQDSAAYEETGLTEIRPPEAVVKITVREGQGNWRFSIENIGTHIPEEAIPKLFEAFCRVDTSRSCQTGGNGLLF